MPRCFLLDWSSTRVGQVVHRLSESRMPWRHAASVACIGVAAIGLAGCIYRQSTVVQVPDFQPTGRISLNAAAPLNVKPAHQVSLTSSSTVAPLAANAQARPWRHIVLHHSGTPFGSVASIDRDHRERRDSAGRPWRGIGYHFVIGNGREMSDGEVQPTFRWTQQLAGAHAGKPEFNEAGIGICLIGNFDETAPTEQQMHSCRKLVSQLRAEFHLPADAIIRHSEVKATECPGRNFSIETIAAENQHAAALALSANYAP